MTINRFGLINTGMKKKIAYLAIATALFAASSGAAFAQTASPSPTPSASPTVPSAAPSTGLGGN